MRILLLVLVIIFLVLCVYFANMLDTLNTVIRLLLEFTLEGYNEKTY